MNDPAGYSRHDSELLGFVTSAYMMGAITIDELHHWVASKIDEMDEPPDVLFRLLDYGGDKSRMLRVIGFNPSSVKRVSELYALTGIGHKRRLDPVNLVRTKKDSLRWLKKYPDIEDRFREVFPFIDY